MTPWPASDSCSVDAPPWNHRAIRTARICLPIPQQKSNVMKPPEAAKPAPTEPLPVSPKPPFKNGTNTGSRNPPGASSSGERPLSKKKEKHARAIREGTREWYRINPEE